MSFLMSDAIAATSQAPVTADNFSLFMIVVIVFLGYFMLIRPQQKRAKEHRDLLGRLKKGDEVVTTSGMLAKVVILGEQYIKISPAEGIEITIQKGAISAVLPKGTLKSL